MSDKSSVTAKEAAMVISATAVLASSLAVLIQVLRWSGFFDFGGTEATANVIGSVLLLVGTVFTVSISLIGLLLKRSLDERNLAMKAETERRLKLDAERNLALKLEAEERLKLETAIRAVELFKTGSSAVSTSEKAGALFALVRLGQLEFALRLLQHLWAKREIDSPSAVWILNEAFQSDTKHIQELAAELVRRNAERLLDHRGEAVWPNCLSLKWKPELSQSAREQLLEAVFHTLLAREMSYWTNEFFAGWVILLKEIREKDPLDRIRNGATLGLRVLLQRYPEENEIALGAPSGIVSINSLRSEIQKQTHLDPEEIAEKVRELVRKLEKWVEKVPTP